MSHASTCKECLDLLTDYVDGQLEPSVQQALDAHLHACPPCEDFVATYKATSSVCRKALARAMPESVASRLRDFLRSEITKDKVGS